MRILLANDGIDDAGGVTAYLAAVAPALRARGDAVAFMHYNRRTPASRFPADPAFGILDRGLDGAVEAAAAWRPDVCFSHNMAALDVDEALLRRWPVVKMMHGYAGTCVSGQKARLWPRPAPCGRRLGAPCLLHYLPRRCGVTSPARMLRQYSAARRQQSLFHAYASIVVASAHMRDEYVRNGAPPARVFVVPLFATGQVRPAVPRGDAPAPARVLFLGRMTQLKGCDLLIRAVAGASRLLGRPVPLTMAGDGPVRAACQHLAAGLGVDAAFTGWVTEPEKEALFACASLLVMPSVWPEPFGLVGLEAGAHGVPAVAFDSGGVRAWLRDGTNGLFAGRQPAVEPMARTIAAALADPALLARLSEGACEVARELTVDRHVDALAERVLAPAVRNRPVCA
ncbi:MAG TPA: glycosyltransferase family 4 protein [Vicinamibacterales bacterium]|nr:glycosyltransferase family 4 protein [Vicinamibacterales bacterium]